jgi:hypothetical protein
MQAQIRILSDQGHSIRRIARILRLSRKTASKFEAGCEKKGADAGQILADFLGADMSDGSAADAFWGLVKTNLQAGKVRLIFLADRIPTELQRIVTSYE